MEGLIADLSLKSLELLQKDIPEAEAYIKMKKQQVKKEWL